MCKVLPHKQCWKSDFITLLDVQLEKARSFGDFIVTSFATVSPSFLVGGTIISVIKLDNI
jgi:phenolic acid decarboxylase